MVKTYNIAKLHVSLTLRKKIIRPRTGNEHVVILKGKNNGFSLSVAAKSPWNKASLIFKEGKEHEV